MRWFPKGEDSKFSSWLRLVAIGVYFGAGTNITVRLLETVMEYRFAFPLGAVALMLLAYPLFIRNAPRKRSWGFGAYLPACLLIGCVLFAIAGQL